MKLSVRIKQRDMSDCGAACLASVAAHHGLKVPVARIRQWASTDKKGTNVVGMISAAEKIGLQAKGVKGSFESLHKVPKPAIVHVILNEVNHHYVVLFKTTPHYLEVMDPSDGELHRHHPSEFKKIWSGVMILVMPAVDFKKGNHQQSVLARFWNLVSPHREIMIQVVIGSMVYTLLGLSTSIYVQKIVDYVLVDGNRNLLNLMGVGMTALLAMGVFIGYTKSLLTLQTGQRIDGTLILGYYKHLLHLPQAFFDTMRVGEILSRINDAVKIRTFINDVSTSLMVNLFVVLFSFMLMFTYYWKLAMVILFVIPFYCLIFFITNKLNSKAERKLMERSAELESQWVVSLNSVATIKRFGIERHANTKTEDKFIALLHTIYQSGLNNLLSGYATEFISRLFTIILLWVGAGFVLDNEITPGELLSFYALIGYFTGPAASLIGANKVFQNAMIASDRLFEIMDLELEGQSTSTIHLQKEMVGDIRFISVCFRYGSHAAVLDNFSLTINKGSVVALVGESGSGKSTVINILQNLYPIHSGSIRIGEYDLKYIDIFSLRQRVSVVPQKIDLFPGNVIENIALGDDEPDMKKVLSISSRLGLQEFVENLPAGFNTFLGENGATLSGGQRQRIAIARALYRDPEILILDEATSSLDSVSEQFVHKVVEELRREGKTVILIAHRLSSICGADKIVVIENGKLAEEGTHGELMENKAQYYWLCRGQLAAV